MWLVLSVLGCSVPPPSARVPPVSVPVVEPWSGWDLPIGEGAVVSCDPTVLAVRYADTSPERLAPTWRTGIRAAGGVERTDLTEGPHSGVIYELDERVVGLTVAPVGGDAIVTLSLDGGGPAWR